MLQLFDLFIIKLMFHVWQVLNSFLKPEGGDPHMDAAPETELEHGCPDPGSKVINSGNKVFLGGCNHSVY